MARLTSKIGKRGKLLIYADGRKATEEQRKTFFKEMYNAIDKDTVSPDEWKYINRVKGGKERAKNAYKFEGRYISKKEQDRLIREAKTNGINIEEIKQGLKAPDFSTLFKDHPEIKEKLDKIFTTTGLPFWYSIFTWESELNKLGDRQLIVNNEPVETAQGMKTIDDVISALMKQFEAAGGIIKFTLIGIDKVYILDSLTPKIAIQIKTEEELNEFREEIILFISEPKRKKNEKKRKAQKSKGNNKGK